MIGILSFHFDYAKTDVLFFFLLFWPKQRDYGKRRVPNEALVFLFFFVHLSTKLIITRKKVKFCCIFHEVSPTHKHKLA